MSRELTATSRPNLPTYNEPRDGFELIARGNTGSPFPRLRYVKGEYLDADDQEVPLGTRFLADVLSMCMGFTMWENGMPVDAVIERVADLKRKVRRRDLGDTDESLWPIGSDGRAKDPWCPSAHMRVTDESGEDFTLTGSSFGMQMAFEALCKNYHYGRDDHPGQMPVVALGTYKRESKKPGIGKIPTPSLDIVGWSTVAEMANGRDAKKKPTSRKAR